MNCNLYVYKQISSGGVMWGSGSVQVGGLVKRAEERHQRGGGAIYGGGAGVSKNQNLLKNCLPSFKWVSFGHLK